MAFQARNCGNSSVKAGDSPRLVCNILEGMADSYWWKKDGVLLRGCDHIQLEKTTLCILSTVHTPVHFCLEHPLAAAQQHCSTFPWLLGLSPIFPIFQTGKCFVCSGKA